MIAFFSVVLAILFTPGPTNTLLASSGARIGIRQSLPLIPAEWLGYFVSISVWGHFLHGLAQWWPLIPMLIKFLCAVYILKLAYDLWHHANCPNEPSNRGITPAKLFLTTLLNPKGMIFATTVFPPIAWINTTAFLTYFALFTVTLIPVAACWVVFGGKLVNEKLHISPMHFQQFSSMVLAIFAGVIIYKTILV
ncbi:LysE family translocator [Snodgrassella sp. CFCC 13594]|uniref:LysE family translocator n=1 Tax=Snodgrassella sp. CFCC 13594 TaxID=1775559 RepID=UPI00083092BE|nr:LysE family transporter [Snodgrassella sp. CFCC 13594]